MRATQYLPDISRLQRCLYDRFNHQVDRKDVKNQTIAVFIKQLPNGKKLFYLDIYYRIYPRLLCSTCFLETIMNEYREMIDSVKAAWALVGHRLKNQMSKLACIDGYVK